MSESRPALVMVADDDVDTRRLLERHLCSAGHQVILAEDGRRTLALAPRVRPDVILLDVMMPDLDGYVVCRELLETAETALVPVLFVTGLSEEQDRARAFAVGAADYLTKPWRRDELLATVDRLLETRRRWYQVRVVTELWDERPLPEKYLQFRAGLPQRLRIDPAIGSELARVAAAGVYTLAEVLGLTEDELARLMAEFFGLEYLPEIDPRSIQLGVLPTSFCRANHVLAIREADGGSAFVISNPFVWDLEQLDFLNGAFRGAPYRLLLASNKTISSLFFDQAAEGRPAGGASLTESEVPEEIPVEKLPVMGEQVSAVQLVQSLLADAVRRGASDLHLEPERDRLRVRYRVDGRLRTIVPLQSALLPRLSGRFKILCGMDVSENRKPQDGGASIRVDGREVEIRVSTLPGTHGEIVVVRFLGESATRCSLELLGMEPQQLRTFRRLLAARQGMVLVTGPTGSGKSTTLYSALEHLNTEEVNIITVEDPVEIDVEGINQIQIHDRAGRSFASTLRAMLRQDPDIVMVGEIRDMETAEIAARAALTGHLVLSSLHTQHAVGTVARLFDMGVPPYLVASALQGVVAQRLLRRVCEACAEPYSPPAPLRRALEARFGPAALKAEYRKGRGCGRCYRAGTRGRIGVFELLTIDEDLRRMLAESAAPSAVGRAVEALGFQTMEEDAFAKAAAGLLPPEEILSLGMSLAAAADLDEPTGLPFTPDLLRS